MKLNIENATKLRDFLRAIPATNFGHGSWFDGNYQFNDEGDIKPISEIPEVEVDGKNVCGTSACIGGWAVILGKLVDYEVNDKGEAVLERGLDFGVLAGTWLGLEEYSEQEALFFPWDFNGGDFVELYKEENPDTSLSEDEIRDIFYDNYVDYLNDAETTHTEAAEFLDRMITENKIDIRWWKDIKKARFDGPEIEVTE